MSQALEGLDGVAVIADDILVYGEGDNEIEAMESHEKNLKQLLERCRKKNIKLNKDKLKLRQKEMPYMGHLLTSKGLKPDPKKISAISSMKAPENVQELKRFLGMVSYLAKFLPSISSETEILRNLDKTNNEWTWTKEHRNAFEKVKQMISNTPVLQYFDMNKEITI